MKKQDGARLTTDPKAYKTDIGLMDDDKDDNLDNDIDKNSTWAKRLEVHKKKKNRSIMTKKDKKTKPYISTVL